MAPQAADLVAPCKVRAAERHAAGTHCGRQVGERALELRPSRDSPADITQGRSWNP